ncbi:D-beta-D-heptose 7-phosphate kinase [Thermosulfidibacter takaii ABI70S6]|uniref:D-beta-D-heptose 7-phosphate kinase n=1 Tax=Thermosulfidibacter takaii (strain DSM 17441 / JCM 13301 / NBRC 103674 / ABI70S6) TaxID=1298851 RepID=A0A0S3QUS3_THET7|nr:PfkB family carbohydrate kinase [Thermosulfidibacter takaii]BAT72080.1 D-beta-D-heptose 7-phosphate kinase [Thermosulfidibacter takaii ABI70S6]
MKRQNSFLAKRLKDILNRFDSLKIGVVGDFVLDVFVYSLATRVSREAPVLIVRYEGEKRVLGGGANALNNVRSLGAKVFPFGFVGNDEEGKKLLEEMERLGIPTDNVLEVPGRNTVTKTRILAGSHHTVKQQVLRIDKEPENSVPEKCYSILVERLSDMVDGLDAILISDYGYATVSGPVKDYLLNLCNKLITVDSRYNILDYKGVTAVTPNEPEAAAALGLPFVNDENVEESGKKLLSILGSNAVLITRGKKGMALFEKDGRVHHIDIYGTDEVADVTGAGDTVIATFTCALAAGASFYEAARLANYAGGIVVMKMGTATVSREELLEAIEDDLGE